MRSSLALLAVAAIPLSYESRPCIAQAASHQERRVTQPVALQRTLDSLRVALRAPGVQAAIRQNGTLRWSGSSGTTDGRTAMTAEHMIRIGSVTKTYTAAVVLQLASEGRLRLDDTLARWFPEVRNARRITVQHLLTHTSGLRELLEKKSFLLRATMFSQHQFEPGDVIAYLTNAKPYFAPGAGFHYSNSNYVLLGVIVQRVTDSSAARLVRGRLLDPLRPSHTVFLPDERSHATVPGIAMGFDRDHIPKPGAYKVSPDNRAWASLAYTSGAIAASAADVAQWTEALMTGAVLPESLVARASATLPAGDSQIPELKGYGLGLELLDIDGTEWLGHLGDFIGSGGAALFSRRTGITIAVFGNMSAFDAVAAVRALSRTLREVSPGETAARE